MTSSRVLAAAGCLFLSVTARADNPPPARAGSVTAVAKAGPPSRVGQIFIIGNESTPQDVILRRVPLFPGTFLDQADLRRAEKNLARLWWILAVDKDVRPRVQVLVPNGDQPKEESEIKDILVTVRERPLTPHFWRVADAVEQGVRFECVRRVIGPLAAVPLVANGEINVADACGTTCEEIAVALIRGEPADALALLQSSALRLPTPATPPDPETPAPPS